MTYRYHSLLAQTAYSDLLRVHLDEQVGDIVGDLVEKKRGSRTYLYDTFRVGDRVISRYIGDMTDDLRDALRRKGAIKAERQDRQKTRTRLSNILKAEGMTPLDVQTGSVLFNFARLGAFRLGATLVGTMAFRLYEGELALRMDAEMMAQTGDIDIASFGKLSLALEDHVTEPIAEALKLLSFDPLPALDHRHTWRWRDKANSLSIEFLTPAFGDETPKPLPALGVSAQGLHYLNYLIAEPLKAVALYRSGVLVQIPRPERYAIHKLIIADRRTGTDRLKAPKDRAQAAFLIGMLAAHRPDDLADAWTTARAGGPRWRDRIDRTLAMLPESRAILAGIGA